MKRSRAVFALVFLSININLSRANTLLSDLLLARDDCTIFAQVATASEDCIRLLADGLQGTYTLFVPTDTAIQANEQMMLYLNGIDNDPRATWKYHLTEVCKQHMIKDRVLKYDDIFDFERTRLGTMRDEVPVSSFVSTVQDAKIIEQDIEASNGIMHVVDSVLKPNFFSESFAALELQPEYGPDDQGRTSLVTIADLTGARDGILDQTNPGGLTFLGCRIRAFNRLADYLTQSILGGNDVMHSEFLNESYADMTNEDHFEYSLIPQNLYFDEFLDYAIEEYGYEELVMPVNPCAHMWVTVKNGLLCFNDACIVGTPDARNYYAANGFGHVVDKCLVCPGVAMQTGYAALYTKHEVVNTANLFKASLWNLRNLSLSVGDQHSVTLIAPSDSGWGDFNMNDITRLSTLKWINHLHDLLKHFLTPGTWTREEFVNLYKWGGHVPYYIEMLTDERVLINYDERTDTLYFGDAAIYKSDIKGLDGMLHFADQVNFPRSVTETCYDAGNANENFTIQIAYINTLQIRQDLRSLSPLTAMYAPNEAWRNYVFEIDDISNDVLENHVFAELWWCDTLRGMEGFRLTSHNGETWRISVNEDNMPCFDTISVFGGGTKKACIVKCDILVRNGLVHYLDDLMLFKDPKTNPPQPTHSPNFDPNSTNYTKWGDTDDAFVVSTGSSDQNTEPSLIASNDDSGVQGTTTVNGLVSAILVLSMVILCSSAIH